MEYDPTRVFKTSFALILDERTPTRSPEEAWRLHQMVCAILEHVFVTGKSHVRAMERPDVKAIYSSMASAACASGNMQLLVLFRRWNDLARAGFVAHHVNLDLEANSVIYYYGLDNGHSFLKALGVTRYNLVLCVLFWAAAIINNGKSNLGDAFPLIYEFACAWLESIGAEDDFTARGDSLSQWQSNQFDLTWFTAAKANKMKAALKKLEAGLPPLEGDAGQFMVNCRLGLIDQREFERVGPAMSLHFLLAKERKAKEEAAERKRAEDEAEEAEKAAEEAEVERKAANLEVLLARKDIDDSEGMKEYATETVYLARGMKCSIEEGAEVSEEQVEELDRRTIELEDEDEFHVEFSDEEDDAMDTEDAGYLVPPGIDLTRVDWDGPLLQALLSVDTSIAPRARPQPVRNAWISQEEGLRVLWDEVDDLAEGLAKLTH